MGHLYRICVPSVDREGSLGRRSINVLLVALGGAIGPAARYLVGTFIANRFDPDFPWGTCIVNVSGSFVIGAILSLVGGGLLPAGARLFLAVGILEATRRSRPTHMRRSNSSRTASLGRPRPTLSVRSSRGSPLSIWVKSWAGFSEGRDGTYRRNEADHRYRRFRQARTQTTAPGDH